MTATAQPRVALDFQGGTLRVRGVAEGSEAPPGAKWDPREAVFRAMAIDYAPIVLWLKARGLAYEDAARAYKELELRPLASRRPYPHQDEAMRAWSAAQGRGVVVLPTGAGKTFVAALAIAARKRSTLVVVPTLDLLGQWHDVLEAAFDTHVGLLGGGYHDIADVTVTTYDSAHIHMDRLGARFGLVVFDECHHLPSDANAQAARMCLAPFRLGLTATPERADGRHAAYEDLVGPIVYRRDIGDLAGQYLAPYDVERLEVPLSTEERERWSTARAEYVGFLRKHGIRMGSPDGWSQFLLRSSVSDEGRRAFQAYRLQRQLALAAPGKLDVLRRLLHRHRNDRVLVFTEDNATVYKIARDFLVPAITHQTRVKERSAILAGLSDGSLGCVVTSKVLNEGVDVPTASVAIVLSGNASVREHVQRLGRVLRKADDKRAILYELIAAGTGEESTSERRRQHEAYE